MIRVFPRRTHWTPTDELAFYGPPPLFRPASGPVFVSVVFTWDKKRGEELKRQWERFYFPVTIGGPAYEDAGGDFTPGLFMKTGCTITSRGCPKKCSWCVVPRRSGPIRELTIKPGWIVQDDNLLATSEPHTRAVFDMLQEQNRNVFFNGGLDKHFLKDWHIPLFHSIKIGELWFACDVLQDLGAIERASGMLDGIPLRKRRCYTMIDPNTETLRDAEFRLERVLELGFMPFCQLYQSDTIKTYPEEWRKLQRKWARPAAYMSHGAIDDTLFSDGTS